jgi:hypothetical protein
MSTTRQPSKKIVYTQQSDTYTDGTHMPSGKSWTAPTVILPKAFDDSCRLWTVANNPVRDAYLLLDTWIAAGKPGLSVDGQNEVGGLLVGTPGADMVAKLDARMLTLAPQVGDVVCRMSFNHTFLYEGLIWALANNNSTLTGLTPVTQGTSLLGTFHWFLNVAFSQTRVPDWEETYLCRYELSTVASATFNYANSVHGILVDSSAADGTGAIVQTQGLVEDFTFGDLDTHKGTPKAGDPVYMPAYTHNTYAGEDINTAGNAIYTNTPEWINLVLGPQSPANYSYLGRCASLTRDANNVGTGSLYLDTSREPLGRVGSDALSGMARFTHIFTPLASQVNSGELVVAPPAAFAYPANSTSYSAKPLKNQPAVRITTKYNPGHADRHYYAGTSIAEPVGDVISGGGLSIYVDQGVRGDESNTGVKFRLETIGDALPPTANFGVWSPLLANYGSSHSIPNLGKQAYNNNLNEVYDPFVYNTYQEDPNYSYTNDHLNSPTRLSSHNNSSLVIGNYPVPNGVGILGDLLNVTDEPGGREGDKGRSIRGFRHAHGLQRIECGYWKHVDASVNPAVSVEEYEASGLEVIAKIQDPDPSGYTEQQNPYSFKVRHQEVLDDGTTPVAAQDDLVVRPYAGQLDISNIAYDADAGINPTLYSGTNALTLRSDSTSNVAFTIEHQKLGHNDFRRWFKYDHTTNQVQINGDLDITGELNITGEVVGDLILQHPHKIKASSVRSNAGSNTEIMLLEDPAVANQSLSIRAGTNSNSSNELLLEGGTLRIDTADDSNPGFTLDLNVTKTQAQLDDGSIGTNRYWISGRKHGPTGQHAWNGNDFEVFSDDTTVVGGTHGVNQTLANNHYETHSPIVIQNDQHAPKAEALEISSRQSLVLSAGVSDDPADLERSFIAFKFSRLDNSEPVKTAMLLDRLTGVSIDNDLVMYSGTIKAKSGADKGVQFGVNPANRIAESNGHVTISAQGDIINHLDHNEAEAPGNHKFKILNGSGTEVFSVDEAGTVTPGHEIYLDPNKRLHLGDANIYQDSTSKDVLFTGDNGFKFYLDNDQNVAPNNSLFYVYAVGIGFMFRGEENGDFTINGSYSPFTGSHVAELPEDCIDRSDLEGLIFCSSGNIASIDGEDFSGISVNDTLLGAVLSSERNLKSVYGVFAKPYKGEDTGVYANLDNPALFNGVGEGGIWVCNVNGNLENGDYITTCEAPGLGMKQDDDLLHNYTVAKITMDCAFDLESTTYRCEEFKIGPNKHLKAFVGCTYHCG